MPPTQLPELPEPTPPSVMIRPMTEADVVVCERISAASFFELDSRTWPRERPEPSLRSPERGEGWVRRTRSLLTTDAGGCWVAEADGVVIGLATSFHREKLWVLSSYAVLPDHQGVGVGTQLLAAAMAHGRGCLRGMFCSSVDPRAARRYRLAGFSLHPHLYLTGAVDRSALPLDSRVRSGRESDRDLLDSVDRRTRGAARPDHHELFAATSRLLVVDHRSGEGYAWVEPDGSPRVVAASNRRTAADLLWQCLASAPADAEVSVHQLTDVNEWAIDVGLAAGLALYTGSGYLAVRGMKPPRCYLPDSSLL